MKLMMLSYCNMKIRNGRSEFVIIQYTQKTLKTFVQNNNKKFKSFC